MDTTGCSLSSAWVRRVLASRFGNQGAFGEVKTWRFVLLFGARAARTEEMFAGTWQMADVQDIP